MTSQVPHPVRARSREELVQQIRILEERLAEAEDALSALRNGEVDAVIVGGDDGDRVYTLRGADETYRLFVQEMAEGAITLTPDGLIVFSNEQFAAMVGRPLERVIGTRIQDFVDRDNAGILSALLTRVSAGRQKHELRLTTPGGETVPVYMSVNRLQKESMDCICATVTNLTRQKRYARIVADERLARSILQQAAEAILVVDPAGQIIRSSSAADLMAGTPALLHEFDSLFRIRADQTGFDYGFIQILSEVRTNSVIQGLAATAATCDGRNIEVLLSAAPLMGLDSRLLGCVITLTDISETKKAFRLLEEAGRRFRGLVESNIVGIVIATEKRVVEANAMILGMLGYSQSDFLAGAVDWRQSTPDEYRDRDASSIERLRSTGACPPYEKEYIRKDGSRISVLTGGAVLSFEPELEWINFVVDITAQRSVERDLRRANADLEQFAYSASHDLREPLRNVSIYSELLCTRYSHRLDRQALEFLSFVKTGASRMEMLVQDLLAYTQVTGFNAPVESCDANAALQATLLNLKNAIAESGAVVTTGPLPVVRMHNIHLQQLFQNLIGNALKYHSEQQPLVHVSAAQQEGFWRFAVRDNGIGIDPHYKEKIFGLFKRLHTGEQYAGTGIGLAICQRIVERNRGSIWVESQPGEGSTFYFTIPV